MPPMSIPRIRLTATPTRPMDIEILVPIMSLDHMSLPNRSVPRG